MTTTRHELVLGFVDRASRPMLEADRRVRTSLQATQRAYRATERIATKQGSEAAGAARKAARGLSAYGERADGTARDLKTLDRAQQSVIRDAGRLAAQVQHGTAGYGAHGRAARAAEKETSRLGGALRRQASDVRGMATGLVAGFGVLKAAQFIGDSVKQVEGLARATVKLQAITGQDATTASAWVQVAKQRGLAAKQLNQSFITLEKNQVKAAAGSKTQAEAFAKLGISQQALKRSSPEQILERVSDGFQRMGPGAQRAALAQTLFARGGQLLIGVLSKGGKGVRDMIAAQKAAGKTLDEDGVKKTLELVAAQRHLDDQMTGLKVTLGLALVPGLTIATKALVGFITQLRSGKGFGGQVRRVFEQMAQGARDVWTFVRPAVSALAGFAKQHPGLVKAAGGILAVGVALRALRFTSAITGVTSLGRLLLGLGRTRAGAAVVSAVAGPIGRLAGRLAGPVAAAGRALLRLGGYGVRAGASAAGAVVARMGALARRLASPLAAAGGKIIDAIGGAGVAGGARARDSILKRVQGIRPKAGGALLGAFRGLGVALGAAAGIGIANEIAKALRITNATTGGSGDQRVNRATGDPQQDIVDRVRNFLGLRRGGIVPAYQAGGVVPAMVSPGEMIVHQGRAGMVPGHPVAADNVAMMLPVGAAVLTGDGQRMVSQGASIGEAIARQAPHFKAGGHVRGKLSWFGGPHDSQDSGRTALGLTTATPGVAIRPGDTWQTGRATLGAYWRIRTPNGRSAVLRQTDLGPNESTGRRIDLTYSALGRLGYSEGNFPTDRVGVADLVGGGAARAASYRLSGYAAALARRVGASRIRSGILPDAFEQGIQQGEAGMTRARLRALGDPVYRAISAAYRVPGDRIVRVAGGRGGGSSLVSARRPIGDTWAWARALASRFGLRVSSNYRTPAHNRAVGGVPNSWHIRGSARRPEAFDFVPPSQAALGWVRSHTHPAEAMIHNAGSGLHLHVGGLYRRGGIVSRFQTGGRVPRYTYATPGERGRTIRGDEFGVYNQPSRGFGAVLGGAMFPVVRAANATFAKRFAALNAAIQNAAADKIAALRRGLTGAVRRGGSELAVKRMQQAISLIDYELGRRIGLLSRRIAARTAAADTRVARTDIGLRIRGINPDSPAAITERLGAERFRGDALHRTGRDLARQLRLAEKARNLAKITEIRQEIADNQTAILDSRANQAELGRARAEAEKAAAALRLEQRNAVYQYVADMAGSATGLAQSGLQTLELQQRLAGTYDQGGQTRADYIRSQIVPDLQAEQAAIEQQRQEAARQGNQQLAAQLAEALAAKQNEVLQSQLDAQEATAQNTAATADAIKSLGGTLGFEFGGSRLTDALLASGVGA